MKVDTSTIESESAANSMALPVTLGQPPEVSVIDILTQLARRKRLIAKVTSVAILAGLVVSFALPVRYTAVTRIMTPQQTQSSATLMMSQLMGSSGSLAAIAGGGLGLKNPNDIYIGLLTSRPIADAIIEKFHLVSVYRSKDMTAARKKLAQATDVTSEKSGFILISVTDKDKKRAAEMANSYTAELHTLSKEIALTEASQRRFFYEEQLKQVREALIAAEENFQKVQQTKGLVQLDAQAKAMIESLAALRAQVAAKQVQVQALRSYSTEHNPDLELAERELSSMQSEVSRLEQRNHSSGFADLGMQDVPGAGLEYLRADHELRYQQALFDMLMKQYDAARLDEAKEAVVIQVVEAAIEPDRRSSPQRTVIMIAATAGGLLLSLVWALILRWIEVLQSDPVMAVKVDHLRSLLRVRRVSNVSEPYT